MINYTIKINQIKKKYSILEPNTIFNCIKKINKDLLINAVAAKKNNILVDLSSFIKKNDSELEIIYKHSEEGINIIRHSAAHLLAHAIKYLFNNAQIYIGPVVTNGFYYDIFFPNNYKITNKDLIIIEKKMEEIRENDFLIKKIEINKKKAIELFKNKNEFYKVKLLNKIKEDTVSIYKQNDFIDLCKGPHVYSTKQIKYFKLEKSLSIFLDNIQLQRVYGTLWNTQEELNQYFSNKSLVSLVDHRLVAKKMKLFHIQHESPGDIFWHENGWRIYQNIKNYIRTEMYNESYKEVSTPQIINSSLWNKSGHTEKFLDNIFFIKNKKDTFVVKPMNCPGHIQIFNNNFYSYKDLPIRYSEFGSCHRNEISGSLHGLMRLRKMTQDDGHIFCMENQIEKEIQNFINHAFKIYKTFNFINIIIYLSTKPKKYIGSNILWKKSEDILINILNKNKLNWSLNKGQGAFYGPKIEFHFKDSLNRFWQTGTVQLDFFTAKKLNAYYIDNNNKKINPILIHRAILGSIERFLGILLEHYNGFLPLWIAPCHMTLLSISKNEIDYLITIKKILKKHNFLVEYDISDKKINVKIREYVIKRIPYLIIIGKKEVKKNTINIRFNKYSHDKRTKEFLLKDFIKLIHNEILEKK